MYKKEPVIGFEEYQVDTNGIVYSKKGKPLKYSINHNGYCIVNFYVNRKRFGLSIHSIVAKQFIPNKDPFKNQVNHINGNKKDNHVQNLEWATPKENTIHAIKCLGLCKNEGNNVNAKAIGCYDKEGNIMKTFDSITQAAKKYDDKKYKQISNSIWRVLKGYRKTYKGLIWKYI